jgi:hypothetical protein
MNRFKPVSALAGFSAILVLGIVFSSIPEVHAELNPIEIEEKIQEFSNFVLLGNH